MMDCKTVGQTAFKLGFDVVLPVADLITDIVFTISMYKESRYQNPFAMDYFILSGNFALFNNNTQSVKNYYDLNEIISNFIFHSTTPSYFDS